MKINHTNKTIELNKTENRAASKIGSQQYGTLCKIMEQFPSYSVVIASTKTNHKSAYRGLNYNFMERYIKTHDTEDGAIMKEFNILRGEGNEELNEISPAASYGEIREWFLKKYPAISEYNAQITEILNKAKKAA